MTVSIAMTTCNGAPYLHEQLASLLAQTVLPAEIVVTDDASTDETWDILQAFASSSPVEVRIFRNRERLGHRKNFFEAARHCRSTFISFCDQDDVWAPDKLRRCIEAFTDPEVLLVQHNCHVIDGEGRSLGVMHQPGAVKRLVGRLEGSPWPAGYGFTFVLRRAVWQMAEPFWASTLDRNNTAEPMPHDHWAAFLANALGRTVFLDEALASYRQHGRNVSGWNKTQSLRQRWARAAQMRTAEVRNRAEAASNWVGVLQAMAALPAPFGAHAALAAERYGRLAATCEGRLKIYTAGGVVTRTLRLAANAGHGGYKAGTCWCNGMRELAKDVRFGVLAGPAAQ